VAAPSQISPPYPLPVVAAASRWLLWRLAEGRTLLGLWRQRCRYRRDLLRLMRSGPHLVEDIGLLYKHAEREVAKPFWRP
jgi:uncharacterized protein YjiS (DUF1127 family)